MDVRQIEYFMALAKYGSFREAADSLYVSQPAVSKQIALLEKEFGFPLFERSYRAVRLTVSGKILHDCLKKLCAEFDDALQQARMNSHTGQIELRLGIPEGSSIGNLPAILSDFQRENPHVILKVRSSPISQLLLDYPGGDNDIVINHDRNLQNKDELHTFALARRRHVAIISRQHPLCRGGEPRFEDLAGQQVYVPARDDSALTMDYCRYICAFHGITPGEVIPLPNLESVLLAVKMCFGIAVLDDLILLHPHMELEPVPTDVFFDVLLAWHRDNQNPAIPLLAEKIKTSLCLPSSTPSAGSGTRA